MNEGRNQIMKIYDLAVIHMLLIRRETAMLNDHLNLYGI
jgi:hypothetical protein